MANVKNVKEGNWFFWSDYWTCHRSLNFQQQPESEIINDKEFIPSLDWFEENILKRESSSEEHIDCFGFWVLRTGLVFLRLWVVEWCVYSYRGWISSSVFWRIEWFIGCFEFIIFLWRQKKRNVKEMGMYGMSWVLSPSCQVKWKGVCCGRRRNVNIILECKQCLDQIMIFLPSNYFRDDLDSDDFEFFYVFDDFH